MPSRRGARGATRAGVVAIVAAPDTVIDTGPGATTQLATASFTFHSTRAGATFSCSLDGATFSSCTSPKGYSGLAAGSHTFDDAAFGTSRLGL